MEAQLPKAAQERIKVKLDEIQQIVDLVLIGMGLADQGAQVDIMTGLITYNVGAPAALNGKVVKALPRSAVKEQSASAKKEAG